MGPCRGSAVLSQFFFFAAFNNYQRLILRQDHIEYFQYGYSLIEALILGQGCPARRDQISGQASDFSNALRDIQLQPSCVGLCCARTLR
jgi:hypothetical protein